MRAIIFLSLIILLINSCGKTSVTIDQNTYKPKIVIHGILHANRQVSDIKISRNFPVNVQISKDDVYLPDAIVMITDILTDSTYTLVYDYQNNSFYSHLWNLYIQPGKSYKLEVNATIDGKNLYATSTTTVPKGDFYISRYQSNIFREIPYRERDNDGNLIYPTIKYKQAENAAFCLLSLTALGRPGAAIPRLENSFIYENPFGINLRQAIEEEGFRIEDFQYSSRWSKPQYPDNGLAVMEINWYQIWFYGDYNLTIYAGDQNFFNFYMTHGNVQEIDGNLHEPLFDIEGDGIGLFGSAIVASYSTAFSIIQNTNN